VEGPCGWPRLVLPLGFVVTALLAGCGPAQQTQQSSGAPSASSSGGAAAVVSGSLQLSGAIAEQVTTGAQLPSAGCHLAGGEPPEPLLSEVDFGSGPSLIVVQFLGALGTTKMPLPGEGPPAVITVKLASGPEWGAGQDWPDSQGTLTLSRGSDGAVEAQITATFVPVRDATENLQIVGQWQC